MRAADWLPTKEMEELTAAIDGVVDLLRAATEQYMALNTPGADGRAGSPAPERRRG